MTFRKTTLRVETLEDRCMPTTWGNPWPDAAHLTLSFVPDGTRVGAQTSNLFEKMDAMAPTSVWKDAILKAFQSWAARAKIDIAVVADNGLPLGTPGNIQDDDRFGDIRIAAYSMAPGALAQSTPFEVDAGTWAGDVNFNSAATFTVNGGSNQYDLFSVAIHEAGHVFGFDESTDPASVMYGTYSGVRSDLDPIDITAIQALYGIRTDPNAGNSSFPMATPLDPTSNGNGTLFASVNGSLASWQNHDFYVFSSQQNYGAINITLCTANISLLTPQVTIFDSSGNTIITAIDSDPRQGGFVIRLTNVAPQNTFYIEVKSSQENVFGVGNYQLRIRELPVAYDGGPLSASVSQGAAAVATGLVDPFHNNTSFATATALASFLAGPNSTAHNSARGTLNASSDAAYYSMQAPVHDGSSVEVLTAMIWGLHNQLKVRVQVFDSQQNLVPAQILVNDGYTYSVQIDHATPEAAYYVKVTHAPNSHGAGNYFLGVNFSPNPIDLRYQASGPLTQARPKALKTLDTSAGNQVNLFHFILSAAANSPANVQMTLRDALGQLVFTLNADTVEATTGNVFLAPNVYYATFLTSTAGPLPALGFLLLGDILTSPIGPEGNDPSGNPGGSSGPGGSTQPTWNDGSTAGVSPNPPASNPYTGTTPVVTLQNPTDQANRGGEAVQLALMASDSAGNSLAFAATGLPAGLTVNPATGVISGTIANNAFLSAPYYVAIIATDAVANFSATQSFYWTVNPPIVTLNDINNQTDRAGDSVDMEVSGWSSDGYMLTYSATGLPPGLNIDSISGAISGIIANNAAQFSNYVVTITGADTSSGVSTSLTFQWIVHLPDLTAVNPDDQLCNRGDIIYLAISATCSDHATLTFSATNLPPGLTIDAETGVISGTISEDAEPKSYCVTLDILDPTSGIATTLTLNWTVC